MTSFSYGYRMSDFSKLLVQLTTLIQRFYSGFIKNILWNCVNNLTFDSSFWFTLYGPVCLESILALTFPIATGLTASKWEGLGTMVTCNLLEDNWRSTDVTEN